MSIISNFENEYLIRLNLRTNLRMILRGIIIDESDIIYVYVINEYIGILMFCEIYWFEFNYFNVIFLFCFDLQDIWSCYLNVLLIYLKLLFKYSLIIS